MSDLTRAIRTATAANAEFLKHLRDLRSLATEALHHPTSYEQQLLLVETALADASHNRDRLAEITEMLLEEYANRFGREYRHTLYQFN